MFEVWKGSGMCCEGHFFVAGVFRCGGKHPFHGCLPQMFTEYLYPELLWVVQHAHNPLHTGLLVEETDIQYELERNREAGELCCGEKGQTGSLGCGF